MTISSIRHHLAAVKVQSECAERDLWGAISSLSDMMRAQRIELRRNTWFTIGGTVVTVVLQLVQILR